MGKTTIWIALITFLIAGSVSAEDYGWTLSGSSTDPNVNTGAAVGSTPFFVYLWLVCSAPANTPPQGDGISAAEFSLSSTLFNAGFTPLGGALNAGDGTDLLLAVGGCPEADFLIGQWQFLDFTGLGGTACMVPSPGGVNASVDCDTISPEVHPNAIESGFTTDGTTPCVTGSCTTAVQSATWGALKSLYR